MYFKKNLWQRIKFAFKTLLSDAPLEEMYTTGYKWLNSCRVTPVMLSIWNMSNTMQLND